MKFAYFPGCKMAYHQPEYDMSVRAVLDVLGIRLMEIPFNCCGDPFRDRDFRTFVFSAARNMALADRVHQTILTPCKCCYGSLRHAHFWLKKDPLLRKEINSLLKAEGLRWRPEIRVRHLITVLVRDVGPAALKSRVRKPLKGLAVAAHYGCHALRPASVTRFDNPLAPTIFETLVSATGADAVISPLRLECCGHPIREKNERLSIRLMERKLADARRSGADLLCTACTHCQIQFDTERASAAGSETEGIRMPALPVSQLLGVSFGLDSSTLGLAADAEGHSWAVLITGAGATAPKLRSSPGQSLCRVEPDASMSQIVSR